MLNSESAKKSIYVTSRNESESMLLKQQHNIMSRIAKNSNAWSQMLWRSLQHTSVLEQGALSLMELAVVGMKTVLLTALELHQLSVSMVTMRMLE